MNSPQHELKCAVNLIALAETTPKIERNRKRIKYYRRLADHHFNEAFRSILEEKYNKGMKR